MKMMTKHSAEYTNYTWNWEREREKNSLNSVNYY